MHLAQINIAKMKGLMDSPIMASFVAELDRINAIAESSPGFIWRLKDEESNNATSFNVFDDDYMLINMSVWENKKTLFDFVYKSAHLEIFKRKNEWFDKMPEMHMALWYVEPGHNPTPEEAKQRLEYLQKNGESEYAFTFRSQY